MATKIIKTCDACGYCNAGDKEPRAFITCYAPDTFEVCERCWVFMRAAATVTLGNLHAALTEAQHNHADKCDALTCMTGERDFLKKQTETVSAQAADLERQLTDANLELNEYVRQRNTYQKERVELLDTLDAERTRALDHEGAASGFEAQALNAEEREKTYRRRSGIAVEKLLELLGEKRRARFAVDIADLLTMLGGFA